MELAVRPERAVGDDEIVVEGEELDTVLGLVEEARRHNPENARQLKRARDLALYVRRTGHLPAELPA